MAIIRLLMSYIKTLDLIRTAMLKGRAAIVNNQMIGGLMQRTARSVVLPLLMLVAFLSACNFMSHTHCDDGVLGQQRSRDGKIVAITYARSCANNTALYTWVGLQDTSTSSLPNAEIEPVLTMNQGYEAFGSTVRRGSTRGSPSISETVSPMRCAPCLR